MQYIYLTLAWIAFFFFHSLLADLSVKAFFYQLLPQLKKTYRLFYNAFATISLILVTYFHFQQVSQEVFTASVWSKIVAVVIILLGGWVLRLAFKNYDTQEFIGFRQQQEAKEVHHHLNIQGVNAQVRHPIYSGALLIFVGVFSYQPTVVNLLLLGIVWLYVFIGIYLEERKLVKAFGQKYLDYQKEVKMLIPRLL